MRYELRVIMILCGAMLIHLCAGCTSSRTSAITQNMAQLEVAQFGGMREVMRQGQTEPRISLADAVAEPHAVAVGALEGLAGEVTIIDGEVWVSRMHGGELRVTGPEPIAGDRATLLTLAHVGAWEYVPIESAVEGIDLEALIEQAARARGVDTSRPFPFLIEGMLTSLDLHVINGYCPIATDPATVDAQPWRWSNSRRADVRIVGFYAPNAAGVMTHHGSSVHAHAILLVDGKTVTGHIDRVVVEPGMTVRVPTSE